jgi:hypothetical protein
MNRQVKYSLIEAGYMELIATIAALVAYLSNQLDGRGFLLALVVAATPAVQRVFRGWQDGNRASEGEVLPRDVGAYAQPLPTKVDGPVQ